MSEWLFLFWNGLPRFDAKMLRGAAEEAGRVLAGREAEVRSLCAALRT